MTNCQSQPSSTCGLGALQCNWAQNETIRDISEEDYDMSNCLIWYWIGYESGFYGHVLSFKSGVY